MTTGLCHPADQSVQLPADQAPQLKEEVRIGFTPGFASFSVDTNAASRTDMSPGETDQKRNRDSHSIWNETLNWTSHVKTAEQKVTLNRQNISKNVLFPYLISSVLSQKFISVQQNLWGIYLK